MSEYQHSCMERRDERADGVGWHVWKYMLVEVVRVGVDDEKRLARGLNKVRMRKLGQHGEPAAPESVAGPLDRRTLLLAEFRIVDAFIDEIAVGVSVEHDIRTIDDQIERPGWIRAIQAVVATSNEAIEWAATLDVREDSLQRLEIAVDIGDHRDAQPGAHPAVSPDS